LKRKTVSTKKDFSTPFLNNGIKSVWLPPFKRLKIKQIMALRLFIW